MIHGLAVVCLWAGLTATPESPPRSGTFLPGVVVEEMVPLSLAQKAGIKVGDLLLSWQRLANLAANPDTAHGQFLSPFDVLEVNVEQVPRGPIKLLLQRGSQRMSLELPASARLPLVRPHLAEPDLAAYLRGLEGLKSNDLAKTTALWRKLASDWASRGEHKAAIWMLFRLGLYRGNDFRSAESQWPLDDALIEARKLGEPKIEAFVWGAKADTQLIPAKATEAQRNALRIRESLAAESLATARSLHQVGGNLITEADLAAAAPVLQRALELEEKLAPESAVVASTLVNLTLNSFFLGDLDAGERYGRRAQAIYEKVDPESVGFVALLGLEGDLLAARGDLQAAEAMHRRSMALAEQPAPGGMFTAFALENLGDLARERGDLASAESLYRRSLVIKEKFRAPDNDNLSDSFDDLGQVAQDRGDLAAAEDLLLQALAIREKINPNSVRVATSLTLLGDLARARRDLDSAKAAYARSLEIFEQLSPDTLNVAMVLSSVGRIASEGGNHATAEGFFRRALAIRERLAPGSLVVARNLRDLADVERERGNIAEAARHYKEALAVFERLAPNAPGHAETLHGLGLLARQQGRLREASDFLLSALIAIESQEKRLGGAEEAKAAFLTKHRAYYFDELEVLLKLARRVEALNVLERSRAHSMLTTLAERDVMFSADVPGDLDLARRRADADYERAQAELSRLSPDREGKQVEALLGRMRALREKQVEIAERIKKTSPKYAALQYPQPLDLAGTQAALDPGTLLLSYSIGKEKSFLFVVSGDTKRGPPLPVFTLPVGEKALRESVEALRRLIEWNKPSPVLLFRSRSLYDTLLKPAEALIGKNDRLLILPDGPLHTLPWAALVQDVKAGQPQYLVEWKPIHTAVSATVYAELKKSRREGSNNPAIQVTAFGDPRYPALVARKTAVKRGDGAEEVEEESYGDPQVNAVLRGGYKFEPLPRSRQEVETIAGLYAPRSEAFLGEQATEERAKSIGKDVPLIHYACHAYVNERFPLDSALVFTIPDKPKEGQDNGLLQAWEIFEKVRIDADLVTLSACETGLGKEMGGEGLIGLTRAFQYAGARSILASLWKVEDASTGELMKRFYQYLKAGKTKDEALRLAQIDLIHSPDFAQPKDWAAFQLNGDWK